MDFSWILTAVVGFVTFYIFNYILSIQRLPPGPLPLPIVGNLLSFASSTPAAKVIGSFKKKYGKLFTLWFGNKPIVIVADYELTKHALVQRKNDFSGRPMVITVELLLGNTKNISMIDYGPDWEILRQIGFNAVRKYAVTHKLALLVDDVVDEVVKLMLSDKGSFDPKDYICSIVFNIGASSIFGERYKMDDKEYLQLKETGDTIQKLVGNGLPSDFSPFLRPFYRHRERKIKQVAENLNKIIKKKFQDHLESYQSDDIRNLTDSLIFAKEESVQENPEVIKYLTDINLANATLDLLLASTETTQITLRWVVLYLAKHPKIQEKVYKELNEKIGNRIAVQDDRTKCPYLMAVIAETMRLRLIFAFGLPRLATCDSEIGGHTIPKGTALLFDFQSFHLDEGHWENASEFRPERFLDEKGNFTSTRIANYMPFSLGRRACIGEKLAMVNMFLIMAGILKKARICADGEIDLQPDDIAVFTSPRTNSIRLMPY